MRDEVRAILDKCDALKALKKATFEGIEDDDQSLDEIELENLVLREVRGPEHPGRVRGVGMGPTPSTFFGRKEQGTSDVHRLEAELATERTKRDALLAAERAERDALLAAERVERDTLIAVERDERAKLAAKVNQLHKMLDSLVAQVGREYGNGNEDTRRH